MWSGKQDAGQDHFVLAGDLRVGLYVYLDLPWFGHPFTLNSFRIDSEEQIRELHALEKPRFRYDPGRSAVAPIEAAPVPADEKVEVQESRPSRGEPVVIEAEPQPRVQQLRDFREAVARAEKSFVKALGVARKLNKSLESHPKETLEEIGGLVEQMTTVFLDRPEATLQVMGENCGGEEAYLHSLNVTILCMILAKGLGLGREQAAALGIGALLHDVGLAQIPDRISRKSPQDRTKPERELHAMHVEYGMTIGRRLGLAPEALAIIEQHHELADGNGYPKGLKLDQIAPLARVMSLVNFYDNLCNPPDYAHSLTPHAALSHLFAHRRNQFDAPILQLLIRGLGVYPPGSVVRLSNDAIALVVSVNPALALRPWVVAYDAATPREDAAAINLESSPELSISNAISPALLPPAVYAYLSPRRRITYFFDGGNPLTTPPQ